MKFRYPQAVVGEQLEDLRGLAARWAKLHRYKTEYTAAYFVDSLNPETGIIEKYKVHSYFDRDVGFAISKYRLGEKIGTNFTIDHSGNVIDFNDNDGPANLYGKTINLDEPLPAFAITKASPENVEAYAREQAEHIVSEVEERGIRDPNGSPQLRGFFKKLLKDRPESGFTGRFGSDGSKPRR